MQIDDRLRPGREMRQSGKRGRHPFPWTGRCPCRSTSRHRTAIRGIARGSGKHAGTHAALGRQQPQRRTAKPNPSGPKELTSMNHGCREGREHGGGSFRFWRGQSGFSALGFRFSGLGLRSWVLGFRSWVLGFGFSLFSSLVFSFQFSVVCWRNGSLRDDGSCRGRVTWRERWTSRPLPWPTGTHAGRLFRGRNATSKLGHRVIVRGPRSCLGLLCPADATLPTR